MEILKILMLLLLAGLAEGHLLAECCLHEGDGCYLGGGIVHCSGVQQLLDLKECFSRDEMEETSHKYLDLNLKVNESMPPELFETLNLRKLIIRLENKDLLPNSSFTGLEKLRVLELIAVIGLQEKDLKPFSYLGVESMKLKGYNFERRWNSLDILFPNLETLDVSYNNITRTKELFDSLQQKPKPLRVLNLKGNKISSISSRLPRLVKVNLAGNLIFSLKTLANFPNIKSLELAGNKVAKVTSELIEKFQNLEYLDLSGNLLKTVSTNILPKSLQKIYLHNNAINHVDDEAFGGMMDLEELNLANNNLSSLNLASLDPMKLPKLKALYLADNPWTCNCLSYKLKLELKKKEAENMTITWPHCINHPQEEFKKCKFNQTATLASITTKTTYCVSCDELPKGCEVKGSRSIVDCSSGVLGKLTSLPKVLPAVVTEVITDNNALTNLEGLDLPIYRNLFKLSVANNHLETLHYSEGDFHDNSKKTLRSLNAAHNRISSFTWRDSHLWFGLEFLDLSHNLISHIDLKDFYVFPDLFTLNLSSNHLHQLPSKFFSFFVSLRSFEIANNSLTRFPSTVRYAIRLRRLVISHNSFQNMSSFERRKGNITEVTLPPDIESIEMHGNQFWDVLEVCSLLRNAKLYLLQRITLGGSSYIFGKCDHQQTTKTCLEKIANVTDRSAIRNRNNQSIDYILELQKLRCSDSAMVAEVMIAIIGVFIVFLVCCVLQWKHIKIIFEIITNLWPSRRVPPKKITVCHKDNSVYQNIYILVGKYTNQVETFEDVLERRLGRARVEIIEEGFQQSDAVIIILNEQFIEDNESMYILRKAVHHNIHKHIKLAIILPQTICIDDLAMHVDWLKLDLFNHMILRENCIFFSSLLKSYLCRKPMRKINIEEVEAGKVEEEVEEIDENLESLINRLSQEINDYEDSVSLYSFPAVDNAELNTDEDSHADRSSLSSTTSEDNCHENKAFSLDEDSNAERKSLSSITSEDDCHENKAFYIDEDFEMESMEHYEKKSNNKTAPT